MRNGVLKWCLVLLLTIVLFWLGLGLNLPASASAQVKRPVTGFGRPVVLGRPDLKIVGIQTTSNCELAVLVRNEGPGPLPEAVYSVHHPKSAGVYLTINGNGWGGRSIWEFDPDRVLQPAGGELLCVLSYNVNAPISVKATVDYWNLVQENVEDNNTAVVENMVCGQGQVPVRKLPDLVVQNVSLEPGCKIRVSIANIGTAGVPDAGYDLGSGVAIQMYKGALPWGGIRLGAIDPTGLLKTPGNSVSWVWFPAAANLDLARGVHLLKLVVDNNNAVSEMDETNNSFSQRVICQK